MVVKQCTACKHYWGNSKCDAYTTEIPISIRTGKHDHRDPYENDNGIQYERVLNNDNNQRPRPRNP